jgi:FkbM family methyltransferase
MSRKKRNRQTRHQARKVKKSLISKQVNLKKGVITYHVSKDSMPQFLIRAKEAADVGQTDEARALLKDENIKIVRKVLEKDPSRTDIMLVLAMLLYETGRSSEAEEWYKRILEREVNVMALHNLCDICSKDGRLSQAAEYERKVLQIHPQNGEFLYRLGGVLVRLNQMEEGMDLMQRAVIEMPNRSDIHSGLLFHLHYLPTLDCQGLFDEHRQWARIHAPTGMVKLLHGNAPEPDRRLRVGYISPDFCRHPVTVFFESLLEGHNRREVEVYGYGNVKCPDPLTKRLETKFNHYRNICGADDETVVDIIRTDKIDILVDLAGHTGNNRLLVLAHKPAPIQVTWLGYPNTTGMEQVDYRLTDKLADPPESQQFYTEELVHLPDGFLCYQPADYAPPVAPLPVLKNGHVTFGSFNNSCKINPLIMSLWAEVLKVNDGSRLLLKFKGGDDEDLRECCLHKFEQLGIHRDRLDIHGPKSPVEHLKLYNRIDIALDTYPYNGTTTTFEALWMGVPVISLVGQHHMSRVGLGILTRLGLEFFAASKPEEYVAKASVLAAKPESLEKIRASMRARMAAGPLCNKDRFAANIENAYRKMWHRWCRSRGVDVPGEGAGMDDRVPQTRKAAFGVPDQRPNADEAEHSPVTGKQKTSIAVQDATQQPGSTRLSHISRLAVMAEHFHRTGHRRRAAECALEGWRRLWRGEKAPDVPQQILLNWNVREEKALFVHLCISTIGYSSYYNTSAYRQMFQNWVELESFNPEPHLRLGLLLALEARRKAKPVPAASMEELRQGDSMMQNERSAAALALAQRKLAELALPYDGGRIYVYPDICNVTTYVLLEQGDWFEQDDLALFRALIRPGDKVLDLGANVGIYAISAALRTGSPGRVVAVEPAGETFELLNKSASAFEHMTAVQAAVSNKSGTGSLLPGRTPEDNKLGAGQQRGEKVDVLTVDDLASRMGVDCIDIIKMDVEGHEQQTLAGAKKIIGQNSPIIFYEIKEGNDLHIELIEVFQKLGYDSYYYVAGTSTLVKFHKGLELDPYLLNMIAVRRESLHRFDGLVNIADIPSEQTGPDVQLSNRSTSTRSTFCRGLPLLSQG